VTPVVIDASAGVELAAARAKRWEQAGVFWEVRRGPQASKPAVSVRAESPTALAELTVWVSGEAEIIHARLEGEPVVEVYELTGPLGLAGCLDDLERYLGL
jgi:hypothetical protein